MGMKSVTHPNLSRWKKKFRCLQVIVMRRIVAPLSPLAVSLPPPPPPSMHIQSSVDKQLDSSTDPALKPVHPPAAAVAEPPIAVVPGTPTTVKAARNKHFESLSSKSSSSSSQESGKTSEGSRHTSSSISSHRRKDESFSGIGCDKHHDTEKVTETPDANSSNPLSRRKSRENDEHATPAATNETISKT